MTQSRAMFCALVAFFLWVVVDTAIKLASQAALSPFVIMSILGMVGSASLIGSAVVKRNVVCLLPCRWREQAWIALCAIGINFANVIALKHLPLTMFYVVVFMTPLMIAALAAVLKHERLTPAKITCLIAGFFGAILAVGVHGGGGDGLGYLAGFISITCFALLTILIRKISTTDTVESTAFVCSLSVGSFGLLGMLIQSPPMPEGWALAMMIVAGAINSLGNILYNTALKNTVSTNVAQLHYTQIISGAIFGYFLWHEVPTWNLIAGSIIIMASGMIVAALAHKMGAVAD